LIEAYQESIIVLLIIDDFEDFLVELSVFFEQLGQHSLLDGSLVFDLTLKLHSQLLALLVLPLGTQKLGI
jgi:hypothetical protein